MIDDHIIRIYEQAVPQQEISKTLVMHDVEIQSINKKNSSLEDYFLKLINGGEINVSFNEVGAQKI